MRVGLGILVSILLTVLPRISAAQVFAANGALREIPRTYVDVNLFGYGSPLGSSKTFEGYAQKFGEVATFKATYPEPSWSGLFPVYVGGGFMLNRSFAIGASYSRMSRDSVANLFAEIPDPAFLNALASGTGSTGTALSRTESAIHISLAAALVRSSRVEFRLMGGPSIFTLKGDMVSEVEYEQTFNDLAPQNAITIKGISSREISGTALGFHAGADFTYFVNRYLGIAGGVRFGRATVAVQTEPLSNIRQEFLVGSTTVFLGLRFRLGPVHQF